jgi:hypothetical protein
MFDGFNRELTNRKTIFVHDSKYIKCSGTTQPLLGFHLLKRKLSINYLTLKKMVIKKPPLSITKGGLNYFELYLQNIICGNKFDSALFNKACKIRCYIHCPLMLQN